MAIDLIDEQLLSLRDAARLLPARRCGKRPHVSCLYRWTTRGCRGVVLEFANVGGTRCTSREALQRFVQRLSSPGTYDLPPAGQQQQATDVERRLDDAGIK
jgi:hypothetical protein